MNIMELGAIGELAGGIAVIATLIYLAIQIRQNTAQARSQSDSAVLMGLMEGFNPVYQSTDVFFKGMEDDSEMTEREKALFTMFQVRLLACFQNAFFKQQNGTLSPEYFEFICGFLTRFVAAPGTHRYWAENREIYAVSFRDFVDGLLTSLRPGEN